LRSDTGFREPSGRQFQKLRAIFEAFRQQEPVDFKVFNDWLGKAVLYIIGQADVVVGFPSFMPSLVESDFKPRVIHVFDAHKFWEGDVLPCFAFYPDAPKIIYGSSKVSRPILYSARHPFHEPIQVRSPLWNGGLVEVWNPNPYRAQYYLSTFRRLWRTQPLQMLRLSQYPEREIPPAGLPPGDNRREETDEEQLNEDEKDLEILMEGLAI
jgi:hypothetical protein